MRHKGLAALPLLAAALGLAACSSSPSTTSGTEHATSLLKGSAAEGNVTTYHLTLTGPVASTGTVQIGNGGNRAGDEHTVTTKAGNLVVKLDANVPQNQGPSSYSMSTCVFKAVTAVPLSVVGSKSTGSWSGASGNLAVTVTFSGQFAKTAGECPSPSQASSAQPMTSTVWSSFDFAGPVTVKS
jgi:hypothetical protein